MKARDGLRGKWEAIESINAAYEEKIFEPSLKPEFVEQIHRIRSGSFRKTRSWEEVLSGPR